MGVNLFIVVYIFYNVSVIELGVDVEMGFIDLVLYLVYMSFLIFKIFFEMVRLFLCCFI